MGFKTFNLSDTILKTLAQEGYNTPTAIQAQAIPHILSGSDVLGIAQTGTGKTAAFAVPIINRLIDKTLAPGAPLPHAHAPHSSKSARKTRALILSPTRELAGQIEESFKTYSRGTALRHTVIYGGVSAHWQIQALHHGVDVLVATPGRLLDLMGQGYVDLRNVQTLVLDEADQMLDMGFIHPIRQIVSKLPIDRQSLMFSATMPHEIRQLADTILRNPVTVAVTPAASTVDRITQSVQFVSKGDKPSLLVKYITDNGISRVLVFTRTKHGADKVTRYLEKSRIKAAALHGNKSQGQRKKAMMAFISEAPPVLVATDIAARGLDIDNISHVINYDVPNIPETYVHRIGRTGRAGATGTAISFCDPEEKSFLRDIEKLIKQKIPMAGQTAEEAAAAAEGAPKFEEHERRNSRDQQQKARAPQRPAPSHPHQSPKAHQSHAAGSQERRPGAPHRKEPFTPAHNRQHRSWGGPGGGGGSAGGGGGGGYRGGPRRQDAPRPSGPTSGPRGGGEQSSGGSSMGKRPGGGASTGAPAGAQRTGGPRRGGAGGFGGRPQGGFGGGTGRGGAGKPGQSQNRGRGR